MNNYKKLIPYIFIHKGMAVKGFDNLEVLSEDVIELAKNYNESGADALIIFDLSKTDDDHDLAIDIIKKVARVIQIPIITGGNIKRQEDVKKFLYAGAKKVFLNLSKDNAIELLEEVSLRFGGEKIAVSMKDISIFKKEQSAIEKYASEIIMLDVQEGLNNVESKGMSTIVVLEEMEQEAVVQTLKLDGVTGISGQFISQIGLDILEIKEYCSSKGIQMNFMESKIDFSEFKLNSDGLIPVIVQHYKTNEVLMLAYMNEDSYNHTIKTGKMTYYSRSRKERWVKGETSGHYQYLKSLKLDCDNDTLLAKVDQVGVACHTGAPSCFFKDLVGSDANETNPLQVFESVYDTIMDRKINPKEGSYTNYLFDKGIDKILKKVGEEATELVIAAKNPNPEEIKYELSDFLYHAMVLMVERGVTWEDIVKELADR